jgi:hypothetical protein
MSQPKETEFFQHNYDYGFDWFANHFDLSPEVQAFGEASPGNMIHSHAAKRIARHFPDACLIFVLRDPVERAYSQYYFGVMRGTQDPNQSFSELIRSDDDWGRRVLQLGLYHEQLLRFEQHFSDQQMWIGLYDDFKQDNDAFVAGLFDFIGVDPSFDLDNYERSNRTRYPRHTGALQLARSVWRSVEQRLPKSVTERLDGVRTFAHEQFFQSSSQDKPPMSSADRAFLSEFYAEPNARLQSLIEHDLSHWT